MLVHAQLRSCSVGVFTFFLSVFGGTPALLGDPLIASVEKPIVELSHKVVDFGTHQLTYIRIAPPQLPNLPKQLPVPSGSPTPEQLAADEALAAKPYEQLTLSVTVYVSAPPGRTISELVWWQDGRWYRAWSNADFRLLSQLSQLETADRVFGWFPFVGEIDATGLSSEELPAGRLLFDEADSLPHYFVEGPLTDAETTSVTLDGLDHLHAYYQVHRESLAEAHARLVAHNAALAAELERNPPRPQDTVIHFWKTPAVR